MGKRKLLKKCLLFTFIVTMSLTSWLEPKVLAASDSIKLVVDGEDITSSAVPVIKNSRTLVPLRVITEHLGADIKWNEEDRTVKIIKGDMTVLFWIDSHLIQYSNNGSISYNLSDSPARIIDDRTFVPLRVAGDALGAAVSWEDSSRTVYVDSAVETSIEPFFDMKITSVDSGHIITGTTYLESSLPEVLPQGASEIKYILLDSKTARGFVIASGKNLSTSYQWKPSIEDNGSKILVSAVYDDSGKFLAGHAIPVTVNVIPKVTLKGMYDDQIITDSTLISADMNFTAAYVKYEMINVATKDVYLSPEWDPEDTFRMIPVMEDNDGLAIRVIAYDVNDNPYSSQTVTVGIQVNPWLYLRGVKEGQTISGPVTLRYSNNFNVSSTEYIRRDVQTGQEYTLAKVGYGGHSWFPGPESAGKQELFVRLKDVFGKIYTSTPVTVNVTGEPVLMLQGVGPGQVVTGDLNLTVKSNVTLSNIKFTLTNDKTGQVKIISDGNLADCTYTPVNGDEGNWKVKAQAVYGPNKVLETEYVPITVYLKKLYTSLPLIAKNKFMGFASGLAVDTWKETGMSAALQTAQAILESGWGQSVPVDKYSGQFSYNLFGIKGKGTAGSVLINTWEEYNGTAYRIDDYFRAYNNVHESWDDHNRLLLTAERYEPFRNVMFDSTLGAWALRRCGYATDSKYPMKLMEIIYIYNLKELDEVGI